MSGRPLLAAVIAVFSIGVTELRSQQGPAGPPLSSPLLSQGSRLALAGDSITEQKRYTLFVETYLLACAPQLEVRCLQLGWGGEQAAGLLARLENDLLPWQPDVVTLLYGMNDGRYTAYKERTGAAYRESLHQILKRLFESGATVILASPTVVDSDTWAPDQPDIDQVYNETLHQLGQIGRDVSDQHQMPFADVHRAMRDTMRSAKERYGRDYHVAGEDGVHPADNGHLIIATVLLRTLGLDGAIADITWDVASDKATASPGHQVETVAARQLSLVSHRYPFCFSNEEDDPNGVRSILADLPFHQSLNRFKLRITSLPPGSYRLYWGEHAKEFSASELEQGINLASVYTDNPFSHSFQKLMEAVSDKQNFETFMFKNQITHFHYYRLAFPDDEATLQATRTLRRTLESKNDELYQRARSLVTPLRHQLKLEPIP